MKKLIIIMLICFSMAFSAVNTLKYNGKNDTWTGKWQMSATYDYNVKNDAFSGEETGYYVTKHNCEVIITVFAEENLKNNGKTYFKMTFNDCPYMDSAVVSAYDGNTWIGDFHRTKAVETSYTNQSTSYFGIKMVKNITKLKLYPKVDNESRTYEIVGLHCNDGYEPSKESWQKNYYCLNSDSIAKTKCLAKKNMVWIFNKCEEIKTCNASEDYLETTNICVKKELPFINVHWKDSTYTIVECNDGFIESDEDSEYYCVRICNDNELLHLKTNECLPKPNCDLHETIETTEFGFQCATVYKPKLAEWDNDTTNTYHCVENAVPTFSSCDCSYGYYQVGNKCVKDPVCGQHQYLSYHKCHDRTKPNNSHWFDDDRWVCDDGYFQFDEKCYSNCADDEYFEINWHGCSALPKKAVKINMYTYTCPEGTHEEYNECVSDPIDWSFIKNVSHLYFDLDMGASYGYSKYYETSTGIGFGITLGYNFVAELVNGFQIGFNANATLSYDEWEVEKQTTSYYYEGENNDYYGALTIGGGVYVKLFNFLSYTGYLMLPLIDNDFDDGYVNIKGMIGNKFAIEGEHNSIYFKYVYGDKYLSYKSIGWSFRW